MSFASIEAFLSAHHADLVQRTIEHVNLVALAMLAATAVGVPLAVAMRGRRTVSTAFLGFANVVQTVPSLALLSVMLPLLGLGRQPAVVALFLYALLPVMRNTLVGLEGVGAPIVDTARGLGMNAAQVFWTVELPLALPTIFAGLRTAAVISVGVATLSALVGGGGLGVFIFRGIATSQPAIIFLGAVPAALMALALDGALGLAQRSMLRFPKRVAAISTAALVMCVLPIWQSRTETPLLFGFTSGFIQRSDGYEAWRRHYNFPPLRYNELGVGLLYDALRRGEVDVACGFSSDGQVTSFGFRTLADDRHFFPHYEAALLAREQLFSRIPALRDLLEKLQGSISEETMRKLNLRVDQDGLTPEIAAAEFLKQWAPKAGVSWDETRAQAKRFAPSSPDLVIGSMSSTEQYILGALLEQLVDGATPWNAELKSGLGSSAICIDALQRGDIDLCPQYGNALAIQLVDNNPSAAALNRLRTAKEINAWLVEEVAKRYHLLWTVPLGFDRSYMLFVRSDDSRFSGIEKVSELKDHIGDPH